MSSTETRSGLIYAWPFDFTTWNTEMDDNLLRIGRFGFHLSILDRDLATPPGSPAAGDTYIIAASPAGGWSARTVGDVAIYTGSAWAYATPRKGWLCYIEDEQVLSVYKTAWSAGVAI